MESRVLDCKDTENKIGRRLFLSEVRLRLRLRLRLIYLGRIAEKVKYITYLGCAPARREGSRTENGKIYEE